jgi:hypothetical protein
VKFCMKINLWIICNFADIHICRMKKKMWSPFNYFPLASSLMWGTNFTIRAENFVTCMRVLDWRLDLLTAYTHIVTTNNYGSSTNLHTLQITRAHAKSSQSAFTGRFVVTDFNTETITVSLNYALQISHINSSLHSRTFNWTFLQLISCPKPSQL